MLLYRPESTAVIKGKILGKANNKKIIFKFNFETKLLVSILLIFEKK